MSNKITLRELYLGYPYKTYDVNSSTIPIPYIPKDQVTNTPDSLTFKQWKKIIITYFKYVCLYLMQTGKGFELPLKLGTFQMCKYKPVFKGVNYPETKRQYGEYNKTQPKGKRKYVTYKNHHTHGYRPIFKWYRAKKRYPFKWHWKFTLSRGKFKEFSDMLKKDLTIINKLHNR